MAKWLKQVGRQAITTFLTGLFAVLPLLVTLGVVTWVVDLLITYLGPKTTVGKGLANLGVVIAPDGPVPYVVGWAVVLGGVAALGVLLRMGTRNVLRTWIDAGFRRIPLLGSIYGTSKQVVELFERKDDEAVKGMAPVFCFYGGAGDLGLLALLVSPEVFSVGGRDYQIVIVPTAPVPFGGALFLVPKEKVIPAGISVDALMSIYVSMGVTTREFISPQKAT